MTFSYTVRADEKTTALMLLSRKTGLPPEAMFLLYERFGADLFYLFFLLSGHQVRFPGTDAFTRTMARAQTYLDGLKERAKSGPIRLTKPVDGVFDPETESFIFDIIVEDLVHEQLSENA